jgi:hypothetical protein
VGLKLEATQRPIPKNICFRKKFPLVSSRYHGKNKIAKKAFQKL